MSFSSVGRPASTGRNLRVVRTQGSGNRQLRSGLGRRDTASFAEGAGLSGRAWRTKSLVFVQDLAEVTDCVRAPAARRAGVKSGVCLPILVAGEVLGTMDFFTTQTLELSPGRRVALEAVADLIGQSLARLRQAEQAQDIARDSQAVTKIVTALSSARD